MRKDLYWRTSSNQWQLKHLGDHICLIFNFHVTVFNYTFFLVLLLIGFISQTEMLLLPIFFFISLTPILFSLPKPVLFWFLRFLIILEPFPVKFFSFNVASNNSLFLLLLCPHSIWKWKSVSCNTIQFCLKKYCPYYLKTSKMNQISRPLVLNLHLALLRKVQSFTEKKNQVTQFFKRVYICSQWDKSILKR